MPEKSLLGSSFFYYVLIPFSREGSGKAEVHAQLLLVPSACVPVPAEGQDLLCHTTPSSAPLSPAVQVAALRDQQEACQAV